MATVDCLKKRLDALDEDRGYFTIEDLVSACTIRGELQFEELYRKHPSKTINPALLESIVPVD